MTTATECPTVGELRAFSLGELPEEQSDELFRHLQLCTHCKSELETVEDAEDSLIASIRAPDVLAEFDREPDCKVAVAKALGALAGVGEIPTSTDLDRLPKSIGEYEVSGLLGRGGMSNVYLARHTKLGRQVALKVLAGHRLADPRMRARFEAEMRAIGRLNHPHIVTAHDAREVNGTAVLITEYIDGLDLGQLVSRTGPLRIADACEIIRKVAVALAYTNGQGFVHRDVKPSNIMLSSSGEVKLLDLGLARLQLDDHDRVEITGTGQAMGTADYVAPEQVSDSRNVDVRADIYSLGCTLFKLLTGSAPFADRQHATAFAKMAAHVSIQPPNVSDLVAGVPTRLARLVDSMLSKDPENRPQTPAAVAEKLASLTSGCDLHELVQHAAILEPRSVASLSSTSAGARTKPWYDRPVPVSVAIAAGFFGALFGLLLGIVITITYPDGTRIRIPVTAGSDVAVEHVPDTPTKQATIPATEPQDEFAEIDERYAPLSFGVLIDEDDHYAELIKAARLILQASDGGDTVRTDAGTWHRIQGDVKAPCTATHDGQIYGLVTDEKPGRIRWSEIQGHVLRVQVGGRPGSSIQLQFDDQLAQRMSEVTGKNLHQQLAVIVDHRIVAAPRIQSKLLNAAEISGNLSEEEVRFLMQAINGGLVNPVARPQWRKLAPPAGIPDIESQLQGTWKMVRLITELGEQIDDLNGLLAFNGDQVLFSRHESQMSALGTLQLTPDSNAIGIEFEGVTADENLKHLFGTFEFLPDGKLVIRAVDKPHQSRTQTPNIPSCVFEFERLGDFPTSPDQLQSLLFPESRQVGGSSLNDRVRQIFNAMQGSQQSKEEYSRVAKQLGDAKLQTVTRNNLKKIGLAFHNFHDSYGKMPGSTNKLEGANRVANKKVEPFSWRVAILPFIQQQQLYQQYHFDEPWDSEANLKLLDEMPAVFRSPFAPKNQPTGHANYQGFATDDGALGSGGGHSFRDITDGTSNTVLVIESVASVPWTKPQDLTEIPDFFAGQPINLLLADASVLSKDSIEESLLKKVITRNGGERIEW